MFNWDQLRILLAIARNHTLSAAARELAIEHSTVSRRLLQLENTLQAKLFDRTPDGYVLTPVGETMLARARGIEQQVLSLEREVSGHNDQVTGSVRISALDACITDFIMPALPEFTAQYPELEVTTSSDIRVVDLSRREADIAIRYERPKEPNLVVRKLVDAHSALYASKRYVRKYGKLHSATDLDGHRLVGLTPEFSFATEEKYFARHAANASVVARVDSQLLLRAAVRAGVGIGILECYLADNDKELVRIWPETILKDPWWLVVHKDLRSAARIRAVIDFLVELASANQASLTGKK